MTKRTHPIRQRQQQEKYRLSDISGNHHPRRRQRAGFDMAADNRHNTNHFSDAANTDINLIISGDRVKMQNRCRYEHRNNAYLRGIVNSFTNAIIGAEGPMLQMETDNARFNSEAEDKFLKWATRCDASGRYSLAQLLRNGLKDTVIMGEELTLFDNAGVQENEVSLRLKAINPLRLSDPYTAYTRDNIYDGVEVDKNNGAPIKYHILQNHPGGLRPIQKYDEIAAAQVLHLFFVDESEQYRGYPLIAPAIPLAANLRRYTLAVVAAAEQAANIAGVIKSANSGITQDEIDAMDEIEIARRSLLTLPKGWDITQFKAEQPTASYKEFKAELINEIGRCVWMPYIVAAANAQGYNYSSGRLDLQDWWSTIDIVRQYLAKGKLNRIFREWLAEAALIPGYFRHYTGKLRAQGVESLRYSWNWPGHQHVDPQKEATAQKTRLEIGTTTLASEFAFHGKDWERELEQQFREAAKRQQLAKKYGVTITGESMPPELEPVNPNEPDDDEDTNNE